MPIIDRLSDIIVATTGMPADLVQPDTRIKEDLALSHVERDDLFAAVEAEFQTGIEIDSYRACLTIGALVTMLDESEG